jgi:hypothetical protein
MTMAKFLTVSMNVIPSWAAENAGSLFTVEGHVLALLENLPLSGASIWAQGSNISVSTNKHGQFAIHLSEAPSTLVFSCEGFINQEIILMPPLIAPLIITMTNYRLTNDIKPKPNP